MTTRIISLLASLAVSFCVSTTANAAIAIIDYGFNIDGVESVPTLGDPVPVVVDISGFGDLTDGLGLITIGITGTGSHNVDAFFDHEIDEATNTFFNESGASNGVAAAGQSWEIDEPGFVDGDIFLNFRDSLLDNGIGISVFGDTAFPDDVSMAMGWDFTLALGEEALITFALVTTAPAGFYLEHSDPTGGSIFLSSTLEITGPSLPPIPVPAAIWLFASGILGLVGFSRRKRNT